ncbi:hypothetical protein [Pseudonocardia acaciae]|uniref:hypothetical protein n=1 Tax=Pseudonocardia acaciae TaxID=551276 RepID=UPI0012ED2856|nr:hypothetical protein [Pseudonocardia acaciae]
MKRDVKTFFECCFHVADYIGSDPTNSLTTKQVTDSVLADPDLRICEGIANTSKHSVRRRSEWVTAWVDGVTKRDDESADVVIKWKTDQDGGEEDALELAKRCYTAWRSYQKANGLKTMLS